MSNRLQTLEGLRLHEYSSTLPEFPQKHVPRTQLTRQIWELLEHGDDNVVVVKGQGSSGKTVLLSEFARTYSDRVASFFVGADYWRSSPVLFLREMCGQMKQAVPRYSDVDVDGARESQLRDLFERLYRRLASLGKRTERPFVFLVDSLDRVRTDRGESNILDLLPSTPLPGTRLLCSCTTDTKLDFPHFPYPIPVFSESETKCYLSDLIDDCEARSAHKASSGNPGYLAHVRRAILEGATLSELLDSLPTSIAQLLEQQWTQLLHNEKAPGLLATLSRTDEIRSAPALAEVMQISVEDVILLLDCCSTFVEFDPEDLITMFISDSHRNFVVRKTESLSLSARERLVYYYEQNPTAPGVPIELPLLYQSTDNYERLKDLVSGEYLVRGLSGELDLSSVRRSLRVLADMAKSNEDWETVSFGCLADSVLGTLISEGPVIESKVDALLALGDMDGALQTAYMSRLPADRLVLTAKVCESLMRSDLPISADLIDGLEVTLSQIVDVLPESRAKLARAAASIFPVKPEMSVSILRRISESVEGQQGHLLDVLLGSLALSAEDPTSAQHLQQQMTDEKTRNLIQAHSPVLSKIPVEEVLEQAEQITDSSLKILLLRSWCKRNRRNAHLGKVVSYTLDFLTGVDDYALTLRDLRGLAQSLTEQDGPLEARELVSRIELMRDTCIPNPVEEKLRLNLALARVEMHWASESSEERLFQTYLDALEIDEPETRCFVLSHVARTGLVVCAEDHSFQTEVHKSLMDSFREYLDDSALQDQTITRTLQSVVRIDVGLARDMAGQLNTEDRRNWAYEEVLKCHILTADTLNLGLIRDVLMDVSSETLRNGITVKALRALNERGSDVSLEEPKALLNQVLSMRNGMPKAYACAHYLSALGSENQDIVPALLRAIESALGSTEDVPRRISVGYTVCSIISRLLPKDARRLFEQCDQQESELSLREPYVSLLETLTALMIRTIPDLHKSPDRGEYIGRILAAIRKAPISVESKCRLLTALGLRLNALGDEKNSSDLARQCLEIIDRCAEPSSRLAAIMSSAALLFVYGSGVMFEVIRELPPGVRDIALRRSLSYVLTKKPPSDPVDLSQANFPLDWRDLLRTCELIAQMNNDSAIDDAIRLLVDRMVSVSPNGNLNCLFREKEALQVARKLASMISLKLPSTRGIIHQGYVITCQASLAKLREAARAKSPYRAKGQWNQIAPTWGQLVQKAREIPNASDRAYVLIAVGQSCIHDLGEARAILGEAQELVETISSVTDRMDRFCLLAQAYKKISAKDAAKYILQQALPLWSPGIDNELWDNLMGRIIDMAYSLDPEFGLSIASKIENPRYFINARNIVKCSELKANPLKVSERNHSKSVLLRASNEILESCYSGRTVIQDDNVVGEWVYKASVAGMDATVSAVSWYVENAIQRTIQTSRLRLAGLFACLVQLYHIVVEVGSVPDQIAATKSTPDLLLDVAPSANIQFFRTGEREKALEALENWLHAHSVSYIKIHDPFFGPADLSLLKSIPLGLRVIIVTSWKGQGMEPLKGRGMIEQMYRDVWESISDQRRTNTVVQIVGVRGSGDSPMHARLIISEDNGLRLDTSINGLGSKDTYIQYLEYDEECDFEQKFVDPMIVNPPSAYKGVEMINYSFSL